MNLSGYFSGRPAFAHADLATLARDEGAESAWRQGFSKHGPAIANAVTGDFAVGLHLPAGGAFLAVDRFAIRSICYRVRDGRMEFAARADELADASPALDPQSLFDYLYFHVIPSPRTVFRDVFRVPPGHYVLFQDGRLTVAPYWTPRFEEGPVGSFESLREEFRTLVRDSVASRVEPGVTGCFLSGGTDSSTVAGMLTQVLGEPAPSYSIGFDAEGYDEMEYARIAARHFGTRHHEHYITPDILVRDIPGVAAHYDQPFGNSSALPAFSCARLAREDGIRTLLAGDGGDELFGGNTRYAKQRVFGVYDALPKLVRRGLADPLTDSGLLDRIPLARKGASYVRQARVPMPDRMGTYNLLMRLGVGEVLTPTFLDQVDAEDPLRQQREVYDSCPPASLVNRMLAFDWRYTLAENDLPKVCGTAQLAGVNVGFPLLDDRILEFSLRLPTRQKLKGLKLRWFFKEALRGFLPDAIITKKKHGFGLPFGVWAAKHEALGKLARDSVSQLAERGIVQPAFARALFSTHLPAHPGYYGEMVWILMMLEQWLRARAPDYRVR